IHRYVALAAGTHHGREEPRFGSVLDVVDRESVEVADEHQVPAEGEIRVGKDDLQVLIGRRTGRRRLRVQVSRCRVVHPFRIRSTWGRLGRYWRTGRGE